MTNQTGTRFPLRIADNRRYLVDADGRPTFLHGDTAWSLIVGTDRDGVERYLDDRCARGFNSVVINLIERLFSPNAPFNVFGDAPFDEPGRIVGPNDAYFAHAVWVVEQAARRGLAVLLAPAYLGYALPHTPGYDNAEEGWNDEVLATSLDECADYGRYVAGAFAGCHNIIWVMSGDRNPGPALEHVRAIATAIAASRPGDIFTAHVHPDDRAIDHFPDDEWFTLNQTYSYKIVHGALLQDYDSAPTRPNILFESTYEGEHNASEVQIRRQAYWALTRGACGQMFGSRPMWLLADGWEEALDSPGARQMEHLASLIGEVPWWDLEPDRNHDVVVDGRGEFRGLDLCTVASTPSRDLAVAYLPTPRPITLNLGALAGPRVGVVWHDPISGSQTSGGSYPSRGHVELVPPAGHDWALILTTEAEAA
jgi:hypothetical protein